MYTSYDDVFEYLRSFLSESDLGYVLREDEVVLSRIREFIRSRFGSSDGDFKLVGRERQLFEGLVEEVDRVRFSYAGKLTSFATKTICIISK